MSGSSTYTNDQYKFSIDYPSEWVLETEPLDMTEPGSTTVSSQVRVVAIHSNITTQTEMETKYEELMVMRQVLKVGKDLQSFTDMVMGELKLTTSQIRAMGIQIGDEVDNVKFEDSEIAGKPAKCASLPIYMPIQNEDGMVMVYRRPTYQKWCLLDSHTALVLTYLAADSLFDQRLDAVRDIMTSFRWSSPPAFPELKSSTTTSSSSSSSSSSSRSLNYSVDEALDFLRESSGEDSSTSSPAPTPTPASTEKSQNVIYESESVTILDEDEEGESKIPQEAVAPVEKKEEEKKEEKEEKTEEAPGPIVPPITYKWEQGGDPDLVITFTVPEGTTKKDLEVDCTPTTIFAALKGQTIIEGTLFAEVQVDPDDIIWYREGTTVTIQLNKKDKKQIWDTLVSKFRKEDNKQSIDPTSIFLLGGKFAAQGKHAVALGLYKGAADKYLLEAILKVSEILSGCNPKESSYGKVPKDCALALKYWGMAAGGPYNNSEAMFRLGLAAFYGVEDSEAAKGENQSAKEALRWFDKASLQDHVKALYYSGVLRVSGGIPPKVMQNGKLDDVPHKEGAETVVKAKKDHFKEGRALLKKAANLGSLDANVAMGYLCYSGLLPGAEQIGPDDVEKDFGSLLAKTYFEKARLANFHKTWEGPPKDYLDGLEKLNKPAEPKPKAATTRSIEVPTVAQEESGGVSGFLWDNALVISAGLVGASFAYHLYKKNS